MKRGILILIILLMVVASISSEPMAYGKDEFPQWAYELRRGETIFFGSLPLTFLASTLLYNTALTVGMDAWTTDDTTQTLYLLSSAAVISLGIAVIDAILSE